MNLTNRQTELSNCLENSYSHCRKLVFAIISLGVLLLLIYGNSFDGSWQFDDHPNIVENPYLHMEEITWQSIRKALFSHPGSPNFPYRPVACLTFALNHLFGGLEVFGYHLVNLLIHWLSCIFLFLFIYHTLNLPKLKDRYGPTSYGLALLATAFWAINPVQVQAVTYIVQRMASLAGMFFILSMYFYLKARTSTVSFRVSIYFVLCAVAFLMALGSKENAAILPIVIFVYEVLLIQGEPARFIRNNLTLILIVLAGTLLLGIGYTYFKSGSIFSFLQGYETKRPFSLEERIMTQPRIIFFYISLLMYPLTDRLNIAHSIELSRSLVDPASTILAILGIGALIGFSFLISRKAPLIAFCILFYFLNHAIESTIIPLEMIYEHRNYIPSMLFFLPFMIAFVGLKQRFNTKKSMQFSLTAFLALVLVGFGHASHLRNLDWKTQYSLWADALRKSPELLRPYHNLANEYTRLGQTERAIELYTKSLTKNANNRKDEIYGPYYNLGNAYYRLAEYYMAIKYYNLALTIKPEIALSHNNLAMVYDEMGNLELFRKHISKAFRLSPGDPSVNLNLARYYLTELEADKALRHLKIAIDQDKDQTTALMFSGIAYKQMSQLGRSARYFKEALKREPRLIQLYLHLAEVYERSGRHERAAIEAEKALTLIRNKQTLEKTLKKITMADRRRNLEPDGEVVIPLLKNELSAKEEALRGWSDLLAEHIKRHE